jgi:hypothetical protein
MTFLVDKIQIPMSLVLSATGLRFQIYSTRGEYAYHNSTYQVSKGGFIHWIVLLKVDIKNGSIFWNISLNMEYICIVGLNRQWILRKEKWAVYNARFLVRYFISGCFLIHWYIIFVIYYYHKHKISVVICYIFFVTVN